MQNHKFFKVIIKPEFADGSAKDFRDCIPLIKESISRIMQKSDSFIILHQYTSHGFILYYKEVQSEAHANNSAAVAVLFNADLYSESNISADDASYIIRAEETTLENLIDSIIHAEREAETLLLQEGDIIDFLYSGSVEDIDKGSMASDAADFDDIFEGLDNCDSEDKNELQFDTSGISLYTDELIGLHEYKKELMLISRYAATVKKLRVNSESKRLFPWHYIFGIESGMGQTTILHHFAKTLKKMGLISKSNVIEYDGSLAFDNASEKDKYTGIFTRCDDGSYRIYDDYGIVSINMSRQIADPLFNFNRLLNIMWDYRGKIIFVLVFENMNSSISKAFLNNIKDRINCRLIEFTQYSDVELLAIADKQLFNYGFTLDDYAALHLLKRISKDRKNKRFRNIKSLQKYIEEVRIHKLMNKEEEDYHKIQIEDLLHLDENAGYTYEDPWEDLDSMIGMDSIKTKIKEIVANAVVQQKMREEGLETGDICYHMMFTGNPGTGKTTVARILGRIFKDIGFLKNGSVIEAGRDSLVAKYVGQTAPMVREKVREALGSILFIDEAYSLYGGRDKIDFGYEALNTLIKEMEDKRDQFILIMAGYTDEMQDLLNMNPGLKERVPYKIEFPDYNVEQLCEIFKKQVGNDFIIQDGVMDKLRSLFEKLYENRDKKFGNGRLVRNITEHLRLKHSMRLYKKNDFSKEALVTLTVQDVEALLEDEEVKGLINKDTCEKKIGFL
ncbi:MAG: AAA family ATPase [Bacillota bacterium]